jgi:Domain of unknown function (DUF4902)
LEQAAHTNAQVSADGLIRLSIDELLSTPLTHLISGVDMDIEPPALLSSCGSTTSICGYTEWVSTGYPVISIGWDWCIQCGPLGTVWSRIGMPSSNLLITCDEDTEANWERSQRLVASVVDALPWREYLPSAINTRYA